MAKKQRRFNDRASELLLMGAVTVMLVGFVHAQSQDTFNGRVEATVSAIDKRVERLETAQQYAMGALVANFVAHLFQISTLMRRRRDNDGD